MNPHLWRSPEIWAEHEPIGHRQKKGLYTKSYSTVPTQCASYTLGSRCPLLDNRIFLRVVTSCNLPPQDFHGLQIMAMHLSCLSNHFLYSLHISVKCYQYGSIDHQKEIQMCEHGLLRCASMSLFRRFPAIVTSSWVSAIIYSAYRLNVAISPPVNGCECVSQPVSARASQSDSG